MLSSRVNQTLPQSLRESFALEFIEKESLSPWAQVHRGRTRSGVEVVVKRTAATRQHAEAMAEWTRQLRDGGIATVVPVDLATPNPQEVTLMEGEEPEWWVAYPFCDGSPYTGTVEQIAAAGDLLGRMHAMPVRPDLSVSLRQYRWPETSRDEVDDEVENLDGILERHGGAGAEQARGVVRALAARWWEQSLLSLRAADKAESLPCAGVTSDYKASNLVFIGDDPVLVDPDNGGMEPRIFDLALAVILFHNECPSAPPRALTASEWSTFASSYLKHITLTERERELWPQALDHMLWEEGSWVLEDNDEDAWNDPRQGGQLRDLALITPKLSPA